MTPWDDNHIWKVYAAFASGKPINEALIWMGISKVTYWHFRRTRPAFKAAADAGKAVTASWGIRAHAGARQPATAKLPDYLYGRLRPDLEDAWAELLKVWDHKTHGQAKIAAILEGRDERDQQFLFLHAVAWTNSNTSKAMAMTNVSKGMFDRWCSDLRFRALWREIEYHKKNFIEQGLMSLVAAGNTQAILFANKTLSKDRGYSEKIEIEHSGEVTGVDLTRLGLPQQVVDQVMAAMLEHSTQEDGTLLDADTLDGTVTQDGSTS